MLIFLEVVLIVILILMLIFTLGAGMVITMMAISEMRSPEEKNIDDEKDKKE